VLNISTRFPKGGVLPAVSALMEHFNTNFHKTCSRDWDALVFTAVQEKCFKKCLYYAAMMVEKKEQEIVFIIIFNF
jgi:hypothetical protein